MGVGRNWWVFVKIDSEDRDWLSLVVKIGIGRC